MLRLIYTQNLGWQEFLGFYTGLNVTRKQYDDTFAEKKGIGEEIEDPNDDELVESENVQQPPSRLSVAYKSIGEPAKSEPLGQPLLEPRGGVNSSGLLEEDEEDK